MIKKLFLLHCDSLAKNFKLCKYEQFLKFGGVQHLMNCNGMTPLHSNSIHVGLDLGQNQ